MVADSFQVRWSTVTPDNKLLLSALTFSGAQAAAQAAMTLRKSLQRVACAHISAKPITFHSLSPNHTAVFEFSDPNCEIKLLTQVDMTACQNCCGGLHVEGGSITLNCSKEPETSLSDCLLDIRSSCSDQQHAEENLAGK